VGNRTSMMVTDSCYYESYQGTHSARSGYIYDSEDSYLETQVQGSGTITFWWKVSSQSGDELEFWVGTTRLDHISGTETEDWQQRTFTVSGTGPHTLKWRYVKDGGTSTGEDCGWVDWVQWHGPVQVPAADAWSTLNYVYDAEGRRIEKKYDGRTVLKYVYDGDRCLAEYDASNNLRRRYIYGPGVDKPICMIETMGSYAGTYYYHFDGSGNVVALTNASGNTVEVYEYDVYGKVGATDASHPNRFMFTGREFDKETGLYYYRARYYKPEIGRFLQVDPVGYGAGMNLYRYCRNNPWNMTDPFGKDPCDPCDPCEPCVDPCDPCDPSNSPAGSSGGSAVPPSVVGSVSAGGSSGGDGQFPGGGGGSFGGHGAGGTWEEPSKGCPLYEPNAKADKRLCQDDAFGGSQHKGQNCYRQVVPKGSTNEAGLHCCYDQSTGRLADAHPDSYQPAIGGGGGTCQYDLTAVPADPHSDFPTGGISIGWRLCKHLVVDLGGDKIVRPIARIVP